MSMRGSSSGGDFGRFVVLTVGLFTLTAIAAFAVMHVTSSGSAAHPAPAAAASGPAPSTPVAIVDDGAPLSNTCEEYGQAKDYDHSLVACTREIAHGPDVMLARFWRGEAYAAKGDYDDGLADLEAVAGSSSGWRGSAAIDISMVDSNRGDNQAALDVLNRDTFLYNPEEVDSGTIAVAYNNRCYAYEQLGDLRAALDDCNRSLKYGTVPDAVYKKQKLEKALNISSGQ